MALTFTGESYSAASSLTSWLRITFPQILVSCCSSAFPPVSFIRLTLIKPGMGLVFDPIFKDIFMHFWAIASGLPLTARSPQLYSHYAPSANGASRSGSALRMTDDYDFAVDAPGHGTRF
jgi:hypothetical protein